MPRKQEVGPRFWKFVQKRGPDECWEWQSTVSRPGYGKFWLDGEQVHAHRVSYELSNGPIPAGLLIRHTCDNKICVNPAHLLTGTVLDNARDAVERGLYRRGSTNGRAKLTEDQVSQIRADWARGGETQAVIGRRYGVSRSAVQFIVSGKQWTHVEAAS